MLTCKIGFKNNVGEMVARSVVSSYNYCRLKIMENIFPIQYAPPPVKLFCISVQLLLCTLSVFVRLSCVYAT